MDTARRARIHLDSVYRHVRNRLTAEGVVRPNQLGTVTNVDGPTARVRFDSDNTAGAKYYQCIGYTPVVGDRVILLPTPGRRNHVITGKVGSTSGAGSGTTPLCAVTMATSQTAPVGTGCVTWSSAEDVTGDMWSAANPKRINIPRAGLYRLSSSVVFATNTTTNSPPASGTQRALHMTAADATGGIGSIAVYDQDARPASALSAWPAVIKCATVVRLAVGAGVYTCPYADTSAAYALSAFRGITHSEVQWLAP